MDTRVALGGGASPGPRRWWATGRGRLAIGVFAAALVAAVALPFYGMSRMAGPRPVTPEALAAAAPGTQVDVALEAVLPVGDRTPFLERLRPHFWLGYALAPLTLAHLWPAMSGGWVQGVDRQGLYLASGAFLLMFVQVALGRSLRAAGRGRRRRRRLHFWTMAALGLLALGHVALNSATLRLLFR